MSSLVENLEKTGEANERLEALLREAHSTMKAMRGAERGLEAALQRARTECEELVGSLAMEVLEPLIRETTEHIQAKLDERAVHVLKEFDKVTGPLMASIDALKKWGVEEELLPMPAGTPWKLPHRG